MRYTYTTQDITQLSEDISIIFIKPYTDTEVFAWENGQYIYLIEERDNPKQEGRIIEEYPLSIANSVNEQGLIELHLRHRRGDAAAKRALAVFKTEKKFIIEGPLGQCTANNILAKITSKDAERKAKGKLAGTEEEVAGDGLDLALGEILEKAGIETQAEVMQNKKTFPGLIFVAGGTGFSQTQALLKQLINEYKGHIYFYWGVREVIDLYRLRTVKQWAKDNRKFHFIPVVSEDDSLILEDVKGVEGLAIEEVVARHKNLDDYIVHVSGAYAMVQAAKELYLTCGLTEQDIFSDMLKPKTILENKLALESETDLTRIDLDSE